MNDRAALRVTRLVGHTRDPALAAQLHELEHLGRVETVRLSGPDMARRRQQLVTDRGTELALLLDRDSAGVEHGAVLWLDATRAVVVALDRPQWLVLEAPDVAGALELGYFAGNMHWKVRFDGARLGIAIEGPRADYLKRLSQLIAGAAIVVHAEEAHADPGFTTHETHATRAADVDPRA